MLAIEDFSSKVVNATQPLIERYLEDILCPVDIYNPQPSSEVHQNTDAGIFIIHNPTHFPLVSA